MTEYALINAFIFAVLGILVFFAAFGIVRKIVPGDLWKEIIEERNVALAVLVGLMCVALAIIVGATLR
jgi:putative membrane protein